MGATAAVHPNDPTLQAYGLGKLDDASAESVNNHLSSCADCQRRVAEMSSDSFLGRLRNARGGPETSSTENSQFGGSLIDRDPVAAGSPPRAETLPPGLAEHADYEIKRELGRGGMGVVYLAHNRLMGRDEVLKVMSRHIMERPGILDRFLREIRAVAQLRHPNIVAAYHATRIGENIVFSMEYVEGLDLSRMVKAKGALPVAHACFFAHQAALGLQHAHEEGLVHRDIKPGNLMLSRKKDKATVKILDFGLARVTREEKVDLRLTSEGQALGTPDYIAPEQIIDATTADIRADIYSLGGTLYHLLTGRPPFQAGSLYDMFQAHMSRDADLLNLVRPEVPAELAALVAKMMAKDPGRRFQTPSEVALALAPFFRRLNPASRGAGPSTAQVGQPERSAKADGAGSAPTASAPLDRKPSIEPPAIGGPGAMWESLIQFKDTQLARQPMLSGAAPSRQKPRWLWPCVAAGLLLFGAVGTCGVIIRLKTKNGDIVVKNVPDESEVWTERDTVTIKPQGGEPIEIKPDRGGRGVSVKKGKTEARGEEVNVTTEKGDLISARIERHVPPTPPATADIRPFNGRNFEGWHAVWKDKVRDPYTVFRIEGSGTDFLRQVFQGLFLQIRILPSAERPVSSSKLPAPTRRGRTFRDRSGQI
jgi:serine/threonine protein kinase